MGKPEITLLKWSVNIIKTHNFCKSLPKFCHRKQPECQNIHVLWNTRIQNFIIVNWKRAIFWRVATGSIFFIDFVPAIMKLFCKPVCILNFPCRLQMIFTPGYILTPTVNIRKGRLPFSGNNYSTDISLVSYSIPGYLVAAILVRGKN